MVIRFHSDVRFRHIIYRDVQNWTRKLWSNSDGHNDWHGCTIEAHDISRRSKLKNYSAWEIEMVITFHSDVWFRHIIYRDARNWTRKLWSSLDDNNIWHGCTIEAHDISRHSKLNNEKSREIPMVITCHSDVRFRHIRYRDARNWTWKLWTSLENNNFGHGCTTEANDISRCSKLNMEALVQLSRQ